MCGERERNNERSCKTHKLHKQIMIPTQGGNPVAVSPAPGCCHAFPSARALHDETDALLAKDMRQLSTEERNEAFHDIHGVSDVTEESPEFINDRLERLEVEISKISMKVAYRLAESMNPDYVSNRKFRLMFLRCDRFDPRKAAARLVSHFEWKLELFGPFKLAKDIVQDDLEPEELEILRSHHFQVQPLRDSSGRAILCWIPVFGAKSRIINRVRRHFLVCMWSPNRPTIFVVCTNAFGFDLLYSFVETFT